MTTITSSTRTNASALPWRGSDRDNEPFVGHAVEMKAGPLPVPSPIGAIRTPRAAAVAGIIFSVLFATSVILVEWAVPDGSDTASTWAADSSKRHAVTVSLQLLPFAGIAFLWFIGVLRDRKE
jgi:hypothetical protein